VSVPYGSIRSTYPDIGIRPYGDLLLALDSTLSAGSVVWEGPAVNHDWDRDSIDFLTEQRAVDLFNNRTVGAGWGNASVTGQLWTTIGAGGSVQPTDWQVNGGTGQFILTASNAYRAIYLSALNSANADVRYRVSCPVIPTGAPIEAANIMLTMTSGVAYYLMRAQIETDATVTCKIFNPAGTQLATLPNALGVPYQAGQILAVRGQVDGSALRFKVWADGSPQPANWTISIKASVTGVGWAGLRAGLPVGITSTLPITISVYEVHINDTALIPAAPIAVSVTESLNDNMPSDVTDTSGFGVNETEVQLAAPLGWRNPESYYSPFRADSPVSTFDRDIADVTVDQAVITPIGSVSTRLFTGQMIDLPVESGAAKMDGLSRTITQLQQLIQPPLISNLPGGLVGLEPTWVVSWALAQCGVYLSPPPRPGCRWWVPCHGSMREFAPVNRSILNTPHPTFGVNGTGRQPIFTTGPFFRALSGRYLSASDSNTYSLPMMWGPNYTYDMYSKGGSAGRVEWFIRCDTNNQSVSAPDGGTNLINYWQFQAIDDAHTNSISCGIDINRKLCVIFNLGGVFTRVTSTTAFPVDGAWRLVGFAWDVAAGKAWTYNAATTETFTPTLNAGNLSDHDYYNRDPIQQSGTNGRSFGFLFGSYPIAEIQVTAGPQANPDNFPWIDSTTYWDPADSKAIIRPSVGPQLQILYETAALRGIDLITKYAQAELAVTGVDRHDRFMYLPASYWVETAQQTVADTITADQDMSPQHTIGFQPSKIRNQVSATYTNVTVRGADAFTSNTQILFSTQDNVVILPGNTDLPVVFQNPVIQPGNGQGPNVANKCIGPITPATGVYTVGVSFLSCNTQPDGSGSYSTLGQVYAYWSAVTPEGGTLRFVNTTTTTFYLVNNFGYDPLTIYGEDLVLTQLTTAVVPDAASVTQRGPRGIALNLVQVNSSDWALTMCAEVGSRLARPRWQATNVQVFGDPRRAPGQLVHLVDPDGTGLDDLGRITKVVHQISGASYTQTLTVVQAALIARWDTDRWGEALWGP
jgi:hypothetical protein